MCAFGSKMLADAILGRPFAITNPGALDGNKLDLSGGELRVEPLIWDVTGVIDAMPFPP